jgi:cytochrome c-type biogenesis protein
MNLLQNLLDQSQWPALTALILGLMTAISPCPLATNITAIAYIGKELGDKRRIFMNGLIYTLGRIISYTLLGLIIYWGASRLDISIFFQKYLNRVLGPLLIVIGVFMLDIFKINMSGGTKWISRLEEKINAGRSLGAFMLGMLFALAFCPYSGMLYFGMLIPITISSPSGLYLPVIFAIATGLPVIIIAWLLAFTVRGIGNFYQNLRIFEIWFRRVVAFVFILAGIYFSYQMYIKPLLDQ